MATVAITGGHFERYPVGLRKSMNTTAKRPNWIITAAGTAIKAGKGITCTFKAAVTIYVTTMPKNMSAGMFRVMPSIRSRKVSL